LPEVWEKRQLIPAACGFISTRTCDGLWRNDTQFLGRDPLDGLLRFSASGSYTYRICDNALFCASVRGGAVPALCSGIEAQLSAFAAAAFADIITDRPLHLRSLDAQYLELAEELRLQLDEYAAQLGLAVPQMQLQLHLAESSKPMLDAAYPQQAVQRVATKELRIVAPEAVTGTGGDEAAGCRDQLAFFPHFRQGQRRRHLRDQLRQQRIFAFRRHIQRRFYRKPDQLIGAYLHLHAADQPLLHTGEDAIEGIGQAATYDHLFSCFALIKHKLPPQP
ncbi:MAG: SPFH domain-containing protein, partial [Firmicutes bacterium]|nr:SPFH domain-containing protein [Bacillota bacterium]